MPEAAGRQTWLEWGASWLGMGGEGGDSDEAAAFKSAQHLEMGVPAAEILQAASGPQAVVKASAQRKVPYRMFWGNVEVSLPDDWSNPADCAPMAEHVEMRTAPPDSWGNIDLAIHLEIRDAEGEAHETLRDFFEEMVKSDDIDDYGEIGTRPIDEDRLMVHSIGDVAEPASAAPGVHAKGGTCAVLHATYQIENRAENSGYVTTPAPATPMERHLHVALVRAGAMDLFVLLRRSVLKEDIEPEQLVDDDALFAQIVKSLNLPKL